MFDETNISAFQIADSVLCPAPCRENHDEDKPALNSIADNTVAMEVT